MSKVIRSYTQAEVSSSQPGIEDAAHLVMINAIESGASLDRMYLKVTEGSLAGLDLLWDAPMRCWVDRAAFTAGVGQDDGAEEIAWIDPLDLDVVLMRHVEAMCEELDGSSQFVMGTQGDGYIITLPDGRIVRVVVEV